ncbi:hypothetical protein JAAARDRAFT_497731 [Jaapia argillacea MUCL 33604]|uniref:F-box domain-containing protein n=1 Tax=Jaapia argillacea MUCL 33604 TaxID=933084 RepID=A0A067PD26_9AGAM|nr:hypothetical protein JAAARDRAFT_497731 [Jaapia argillacea MUCL 33604]
MEQGDLKEVEICRVIGAQRDGPLLPYLRSLFWSCTCRYIRDDAIVEDMDPFLVSSLLELEIQRPGGRDNAIWGYGMEPLCKAVLERCQCLESFRMSLAIADLFMEPFSHLKFLRTFDLGPHAKTHFNTKMLHALASLPFLECLSVKAVTSPPLRGVTKFAGFLSPTSLDIYNGYSRGVIQLLDFISSTSLIHISIIPAWPWQQTDYYDFFENSESSRI